MNRWIAPALGASLAATATLLVAVTPVLARGGGLTPPGGQLPATAPGGTLGRAGPANVEEALRGGNAVGVPPGYGANRGRRIMRGHRPDGPGAGR